MSVTQNRQPAHTAEKGAGRNCSRLGKRVTSATCADGCATAASGANSQRGSRNRRRLHLCSRSFPNLELATSIWMKGSPISKRNPSPSWNLLNPNPSPREAMEKSLHRSYPGAIAIDAAVAEDVGVGRRPHYKPPHCRDPEAPQVRPQKRKTRRRLLNMLPPLLSRSHPRPGSRRALWCFRLVCRARVRAPGLSVITFFRFPATWCGFCFSTT